VYSIDTTIKVNREDTIVLGLGFPTLVPQNGVVPMTVWPSALVLVSVRPASSKVLESVESSAPYELSELCGAPLTVVMSTTTLVRAR